jgi:hypothetical protein
MLGEEQPGLPVFVFFIFVGDSSAFEGRDVDGGSVPRGLEARPAKGYAINKMFAIR